MKVSLHEGGAKWDTPRNAYLVWRYFIYGDYHCTSPEAKPKKTLHLVLAMVLVWILRLNVFAKYEKMADVAK